MTAFFGLVLLLVGLGFKIAAIPFHGWVPDVYEGAPTPVTAFLSIGSKAAGFVLILRILILVVAGAFTAQLTALFALIAGLTLLYGNLAAIPQIWLEADRVGRQLREVLKETYPSLYPSSWMYEHGNLYVWIRMEKWFSCLALSLIVVVAGFNIISILTMTVTERRREIGILKAMGSTPRSIGRIFTLEGLAIGLAGVLLGNVIGVALCWIQQHYAPIKLPGEVYIINALPVQMHLLDFAVISVSAVFLCYLFTRFPARDAASLDPVDAIRYE